MDAKKPPRYSNVSIHKSEGSSSSEPIVTNGKTFAEISSEEAKFLLNSLKTDIIDKDERKVTETENKEAQEMKEKLEEYARRMEAEGAYGCVWVAGRTEIHNENHSAYKEIKRTLQWNGELKQYFARQCMEMENAVRKRRNRRHNCPMQ